ncbi:GSCFA domain-containing protein [Ichthyenterobacterium sp. W332]|uniref:GSCFA domain-containing protein n=1 Tax=Microcosmobacter mediterraneus TaxID=3075607 RepID=A0ABU2YFZ6_9FLAO|nr:GSCFA domain-containing protein [Ichthyenterobacterium sp. W332]MDT0557106.1 GSCFA domain-containing protein [Ichthyenterobacterium sp. W332]
MNLQTNIPFLKQPHHQIDYDSNILLLGSCFSEHIGEKFKYFKFKSTVNPFGIVFHPLAIETLITNAINERKYSDEDLFQLNDQWYCFDTHSRLSSSSKESLLHNLNATINSTAQQLRNSTHIIITLGTAWVYRHIETDVIVANCHKVPQKKFLKELLSVEQIAQSLDAIVTLLRNINTKANFIFTVSPVRHLKDGFVENTQSKAHLISGIHQTIKENSSLSENEVYFPAYEIMMDELRDYRFYTEDMIHPNITAINYIWHKFKTQWISKTTEDIMEDVEAIQKSLAHKPFNLTSDKHQKFLQNLKQKQEALQKRVPQIQF